MTSISTRKGVIQNLAKGYGSLSFAIHSGGQSINTTANANDGFFCAQIMANSIGSTLPATIQGFPMPPSPPSNLFHLWTLSADATNSISTTTIRSGMWLAYLYKFGTVALTATGDKLVHDAATFPVKRKIFGASSTAISLLPFASIVVAPSTTAPVIRLDTAAAGSGYINQAGSNVVGTRDLTFPATTTAIGSSFFFKLEAGDSAVQDITKVEVRTASGGATATCDIWGMEPLCPLTCNPAGAGCYNDTFLSGLHMSDLNPAIATSGTAVSELVCVRFEGSGAGNINYASRSLTCGVLNV